MQSSDQEVSVPVIRKLDEVVVNRIAAGEVIHRPASALKELMENSLDAKSTKISIVLKEGGLKLLQITDNGCGIRKDDFPILCERFTTSKISKFEDLTTVATFGFRGEALASVSHVSHTTITSMVPGAVCAYRGRFSDGKLLGDGVEACAGVQGTQIKAEDLFYNVPIRLKALKSGTDEYRRCVEVVSQYAVHHSRVGFTCKKTGSAKTDVHTPIGSTPRDNIGILYGQGLSKELLALEHEDSDFHFKINGLISSANTSEKRFRLILFINERLVESSDIKKVLMSVYQRYLPKGGSPFVYLSISMKPQNLDVNVHPTKREVKFLHEEHILLSLQKAVEAVLSGGNDSRVFYSQSVLHVEAPSQPQQIDMSSASDPASASSSNRTGGRAGTSAETAVAAMGRGRSSSATASSALPGPDMASPQKKMDISALLSFRRGSTTPSPSKSSGSLRTSSDRNGSNSNVSAGPSTNQKRPRRDDKLVRTDSASPAGALEAFLRRGGKPSSSSSAASSTQQKSKSGSSNKSRKRQKVELTSISNLLDAVHDDCHQSRFFIYFIYFFFFFLLFHLIVSVRVGLLVHSTFYFYVCVFRSVFLYFLFLYVLSLLLFLVQLVPNLTTPPHSCRFSSPNSSQEGLFTTHLCRLCQCSTLSCPVRHEAVFIRFASDQVRSYFCFYFCRILFISPF